MIPKCDAMKKFMPPFLLLNLFVWAAMGLAIAWGAWGHQHINRAAVFALPPEMRVFFYNHLDFITEESVVPDLRKYTINDKAEFNRHFIDIESFDEKTPEQFPATMAAVTAKYNADFLQKNGILPWYIEEVTEKLTTAFRQRRKSDILFLAADLGHYLADSQMPLHTSVNHDGQFTDQKGIHAFWESQLPEQFGGKYNFNTGDAHYIENIHAETWRLIMSSHQQADTLLALERELKKSFPAEKIYVKDSAGNIRKNKFNQPVHGPEYAKLYHDQLQGMVERQMRSAISATANFWFTAWVNAGKPDLGSLDPSSLTGRNRKFLKRDYKAWKKGQLFGLQADWEF